MTTTGAGDGQPRLSYTNRTQKKPVGRKWSVKESSGGQMCPGAGSLEPGDEPTWCHSCSSSASSRPTLAYLAAAASCCVVIARVLSLLSFPLRSVRAVGVGDVS